MELLKIARVPPIVASPEMTVLQAVQIMAKNEVGAVVVTSDDRKVLGIFSERDNMLRITARQLDPAKVKLKDVMTAPVKTASPEWTVEQALEQMIRSRYRHLPIVDKESKLQGICSVRYLLMKRIESQEASLETLSAIANAGGPG